MCWFDTFPHCITITTVASATTLIASQNYNFLFVLGTIETSLLATLKSTMLYVVVSVLCIRSPELIYLLVARVHP